MTTKCLAHSVIACKLQDSFFLVSTVGGIVNFNQDQPLLLYKINYDKKFEALSKIKDSSRFFFTGLSGALIKCHDGNYATCASFVDTALSRNFGMLIKYDEAPDTLFTRQYSYSNSDIFYNNIETSDHGFALIGISGTWDSSTQLYDDDYQLVKTDSVGNVQAQKTYGGVEDDLAIVVSEISGKRLFIG